MDAKVLIVLNPRCVTIIIVIRFVHIVLLSFSILVAHEVLLTSLQTMHLILLEEFHLVLTVEIVSQLWDRKIMNCSQ